jgi:aryl-alcohol dehydrogenase-like predicted oxidoreductase
VVMERREVLRMAGAGAVSGMFPAGLSGIERASRPGQLERRSLGRTGEKLSVLGLGGVVVMDVTATQADKYVRLAIERGVNYFDVAPSYGNAEEMLGPALEPFRRDVFLACKTGERRREGAEKELSRSLERLRTDHFDLYQLHHVTTLEEVETIFGPGGAMEVFEAARKAGRVRFLGFSAHSVEAALALMDRFAFDTILFPVNFRMWSQGSFGPQVLERAQQKGMGILALKAMANRAVPEGQPKPVEKCWYDPLRERELAELALRFTLAHPVTAAIPPGNEALFTMALDLAQDLSPLSPGEAEALKRQAGAGEPVFRYPMRA